MIVKLCGFVGQVREVWCPVLYRVAVHHVATFITEHPDTSVAQQLSSRIQELGNKVSTSVHRRKQEFCMSGPCLF